MAGLFKGAYLNKYNTLTVVKMTNQQNEDIVGQIKKAYTTATPEYFRIYFSPIDILIVSYGALSGHLLKTIIISAYKVHEGRKQIDKCITRDDIKKNFQNLIEIPRKQIIQIRLKKQLTDASIEIEMPSTKGFLGMTKRNIKKYGFSKKEFDEVKYILTLYYKDKFIEK